MNIVFEHPTTSQKKEAKIGFSWTMLIFGVFVPLYRGDGKWFAITLALALITSGLSWLVMPFLYNKVYINGLIEKGYVAANEETYEALVSNGFIIKKYDEL